MAVKPGIPDAARETVLLPGGPRTFGDLLLARGFDPAAVVAHRITLDPRDGSEGLTSTADLARHGHALTYERMQDGHAFGTEAVVAAFVGMPRGLARFAGLRRLLARRKGLAPGDIVYDADLAHVFHNFISRVRVPIFYDAFDEAGCEDLSNLVVRWPPPMMIAKRRAGDARLIIQPA